MSGHSKWSKIKRGKEKTDSLRAQAFTKITREIIVAVQESGGDVENNFRLRLITQKARQINMPNDNIMRAIKRGLGDSEGANYEAIVYEGYGPHGVAVYIEALTDNRNRTAGDIRAIFSKNGGGLGETNCVSWMFQRKGLLEIDLTENNFSEEQIMEMILEVEADDYKIENEMVEIYTNPAVFEKVKLELEKKKLTIDTAELTMLAQNKVALKGNDLEKVLRLIEALEENDDVQNVYSNLDISEEELEKLE